MNICLENSGDRREAYLSAQQPPSCTQARLSRPHEHPRRPCRHQVPSRQGPRPPLGLIDRIRERGEFVRLRRDGTRVRIDSLWCSFVPDQRFTSPKVAFAIGRAIGPAVVRNRLRRRLRALLNDADLPPGLYLVGASPRVNELTFDRLAAVVDRLGSRVVAETAGTVPVDS